MWGLALGALKWVFGSLIGFLNTKVEADKQIAITSITAQATVGGEALKTIANADNLNAQIRMKGEKFLSPMVVFMSLVLAPLVWHEWQVVLDSSRFIPIISTWYGIPYITVIEHRIGSWSVAVLPGVWDATEQAIFQSLFVGASAAVAGVAMIKALRR